MVIAVEIDNSRISFGIFDASDDMVASFAVATDLRKTSDEYAVTVGTIFDFYKIELCDICGAVISSVVPQLTDVIRASLGKLMGDIQTVVVGKGTKTGFPIKVDNPSELGADLVSNAAAAMSLLSREKISGTPCVIIDMGTATTVFALNERGEYIGGSIMAGVGISLDALHGKTAQLPAVSPAAPTRAIGKNSQESVRSGVILGNAMMIDGFIDRFTQEMRCNAEPCVIATGEYADAVIPFCTHTLRYVPQLTLLGAYSIYKNNTNS